MIDWGRVSVMQDEIGKDGFAEVATMFLEEAEEVLTRINPESGASGFRDDCHFLKGSALNLGLTALAALCQTAEQHANQDDYTVSVAELRECYHTSRAALLAGLANLAA